MATAIETLLPTLARQVQPSSPLGKILRGIVSGILGSGSVSPQFLFAKLTNADQTIHQAQDIIFNGHFSRGIAFSDTEGRATLTRGKTYLLLATLNFANFVDGAAGSQTYKFVDGNNVGLVNPFGPDSPSADAIPATSTSAKQGDPNLMMIYQVPSNASDVSLKVRCTASTSDADALSTKCELIIIEIPGGAST